MRQAEGGSRSGGGGGVLSWLWSSKDEEEQRVLAAQQSVKAAIEMADAKLRASTAAAGSANSSASDAILRRLAEMEANANQVASRAAGSEARRSETLLANLSEMGAYLAQMDGKLAELSLESDERAKEQARQLSLVHTKLDALLTGSHEQVFHYFILVPKPQKGYLGSALAKLKPRHWCAQSTQQLLHLHTRIPNL